MSSYKNAIDSKTAHINTLRAVIILLILVVFYISYGWSKAPERLTIDIPPDLRSGVSQPADHKHPANVFAFGQYVYQALNTWQTSGKIDYKANIHSLQCYLTPEFRQNLETDYEQRVIERSIERTRNVIPIAGREYDNRRIFIQNQNSWVGFYDLNMVERINGEIVRNLFAQYSLKIIRYNQNPSCNPFGLAIAGFHKAPARLEGFLQNNIAELGVTPSE